MAILLGRPAPQPLRPGGVVDAGPVVGDPVERGGIVGQGLFGDHVADQGDKHVVGQAPGRGPEPFDLPGPVVGGQVRKEVRRLPDPVDRGEQREIFLDDRQQALGPGRSRSNLPHCPEVVTEAVPTSTSARRPAASRSRTNRLLNRHISQVTSIHIHGSNGISAQETFQYGIQYTMQRSRPTN